MGQCSAASRTTEKHSKESMLMESLIVKRVFGYGFGVFWRGLGLVLFVSLF